MLEFDAGYVCGVLCADGFIVYSKKNGNYYINLESKDEDYVKLYKSRLEKITKKKASFLKRKRIYKNSEYFTFVCNLWGKKTVDEFIEKYKIKTGSYDWHVPEIAFKDKDFRIGFLQGFFDGEGTVRFRLRKHKNGNKQKCRSIRATSVNENGLKQVKELLEIEGIRSVTYRSGKCFILDIDGLNRVSDFVKKINFGMERKRSLVESILDPKKFDEVIKNKQHKLKINV